MPTPENTRRPDTFEAHIDRLTAMKAEGNRWYGDSINDIRALARGFDPEDIQEKYYPGWEKADFVDLLTELGESLEYQ